MSSLPKPLNNLVKKTRHSQKKTKKVPVYMKLDEGVLNWFKAKGPGYQERMNSLLKDYIHEYNQFEQSRLKYAQDLYEKYYARCFWHLRPNMTISEDKIPLVIEGLKKYGGREGYMEAQNLCL